MDRILAKEIRRVMADQGLRQSDYTRNRKRSPQTVSNYLTGRSNLLTGVADDLLEWLDVDIVLVPRNKG
jgi:transcriptional regulator with XRE-family HTH domain